MESDASAGLSAAVGVPAGSSASRVVERMVASLFADAPGDYRRAFYAFAAVLAGTYLLMALHGTPLQLFCGHDAIGFLASAWKVRCGLLPHADFHTAPGALNAWGHAAGLWLLGPTAAVLPLCSAAVGGAAGMAAWRVARRRLPALAAAAFAFTISTTAMAPSIMRFPWYVSTYDGYYNRESYAFLIVLMVLLFLPSRREEETRGDDALAGAILAVLLFIKVSYFLAGGGLCAAAFALGSRFDRRPPWALAAGFGAVFLLCLPLIRFDLAGMLADLRMAARARAALPATAVTLRTYLSWLPGAWVEISVLAAIQASLRPPLVFRRTLDDGTIRRATPSWAEFAAVLAISTFICTTNSPAGIHSEAPLLASWLFVLIGGVLAGRSSPLPRLQRAGIFILAGALWLQTFSGGVASLYWAFSPWPTALQRSLAAACPPIEAASLAALPILGGSNEPALPGSYADKVNDGLRLLRHQGGVHRVAALDFVNPFPFALQWPPARGDLWCWDEGFSFSEKSHPSPAETFGDAEFLMIPKYPGAAAFALQARLYGDYIKANFRPLAKSDYWLLLQRVPAAK